MSDATASKAPSEVGGVVVINLTALNGGDVQIPATDFVDLNASVRVAHGVTLAAKVPVQESLEGVLGQLASVGHPHAATYLRWAMEDHPGFALRPFAAKEWVPSLPGDPKVDGRSSAEALAERFGLEGTPAWADGLE